MDDMTNYLVTGGIVIVIWAIGAVYIHYTNPNTIYYIKWLKTWAKFIVPIGSIIISLSLGALFPSQSSNISDLTNITTGGISSSTGVSTNDLESALGQYNQ